MQHILFLFLLSCVLNDIIGQKPQFSFYTAQKVDNQINIDSFLVLLRSEEMNYPLEEQLDTKKMITRFRKVYYGSPNYDKYLIKGVSDIHNAYQITNFTLNDRKKSIKEKLDYNEAISMDSASSIEKFIPDLREIRVIQIAENQIVDIGHVFCGIDAAFHPHSISPPKILGLNLTRIKVNNNQDAVTWVGDLGSIVAEVYLAKKPLKRQLGLDEEQKIWNNYSSAADNLGNIDSYLLAQIIKNKGYGFVSSFLAEYYKSNKKKERFTEFSKAIGLEWNGKEFKNRKKMIAFYADQVNDSAALYFAIAAKNEGKWNLIKSLPSIFRISHHKYAKIVVESFFDALQRELSK